MRSIKTRQRRGVALVELAVSITLLITMVLGCVDAGRFAYSYISIAGATTEAATFASQHGIGEFGGVEAWKAAVRQRAIDESASLSPPIQPADVTVDTDILSEGRVSVTVSYTFQTMVPWPLLPNQWPMSRKIILAQPSNVV